MAENKPKATAIGLLLFAITIFWGAFLLFLVQPLIGKYILPWFGGTPGVWTTCLLFFQCLLLGGYSYAHCLNYFLPMRKQVMVHGVLLMLVGGLMLLLAILMLLGVRPIEWLQPEAGAAAGNPTLSILMVLFLSIGLPYLVLSATGPLIQAWFAKACPGESPYRLYALSNVGSLLALMGFPFVVEPLISRTLQVNLWAFGMVIYALVCGYLVWLLRSVPEKEVNDKEESTEEVESRLRRGAIWFFWLALPACGTSLLMSTTNKMCQDVAVVPFLWVLPLALYLVTFIISFDSPRWYVREIYAPLLIVCWVGVVWVMKEGVDVHIMWQVVLYCVALFVSCMVCHGELYRLRPEHARLTQYYLGISAGGAMGGFFVAVLAPMIFTGYWEYHISLWVGGFLFLLVQVLRRERWVLGKWHVRCVLAVCWGAVCMAMFKYTSFFGWSARIAITFVPLLGGWWITSVILKHWWHGRQATELMEIKSAFAGMVLALATLLWGIGMVGAFHKDFSFAAAWRELTPGLWLALALLLLNLFVWQSVRRWEGLKIGWAWCFLLLVPALFVLGFGLKKQATETQKGAMYVDRNFYGTIKISQYTDSNGSPYRLLLNGRITHGYQYEETEICNRITTYYTEESGAGLAIELTPKLNKRVGVVGMGVGTIAGYARKGDVYRFYDINPLVEKMSSDEEALFTFRINAVDRDAMVDVKLGDARLTMERELSQGERQNYDALILDAFSSDSIPVHLLTKESMELYEKHMNPEGVIAIHISNRYLDLEPVVRQLAKETNYPMVVTECYSGEDDGEDWVYACTWILLTRNEGILHELEESGYVRLDLALQEDLPLWTDDYASIFRIMDKPAWWPDWLGGDFP
ncbi:MAG: hypothetical protein QF685_01330 [Verrucomicrobiota bacterium]|jgi:hypothetical protein|nr:hypothetical protein [Verrucomicrobiota bacterium]